MNQNQENGLTISTNGQMNLRLLSLNDRFEQAARQNVESYIEQTGLDSFTNTERTALIKFEQLKLIGDLTLAEVMLRGQVISEIEAQGLWSSHPMQFGSMEEAASAQGISSSEYSNIRDLCGVVFPYLVSHSYNIADLWESIGKSNFRELIPLLKRAITGTESRSARVEQIFENEINDIFATAQVAGENVTEEAARVTLVDQLVEAGQLPVRELRQRIRPERTPSMAAYQLPYRNGRNVIMIVATEDQRELLNRRLTGYIDITPVTQDETQRSPMFRELAAYLRNE